MGSQRVFLIDGTAFCYRAFYAIRTLSTSDGRPTNAVYGFAMMLQALREKERPDYLAVAFDVGKPTFRHLQYEAYKAQRKPMPDLLIGQLPLIKELLAAYQIPIFEREGYEAEDVLASLAKRIVTSDVEVFLVTGDKDALQLVNAHVKVYNPHKEHMVLDAEAVKGRYGVGPERMVDLLALMGDEIDNIPGVPGIGEKTATQLLQQFGSLEQLYRRLDEVESASRRKSLQACRAQVESARALAQIEVNVPLDVTLNDLVVQEPDWRALRKLFRELEFKRLLQSIDQHVPPAAHAGPQVHPVLSAKDLDVLLSTLRTQHYGHPIAVMSWTSDDAASSELVVAVAGGLTEGWVVRWNAELSRASAGTSFAAWLADAHAPKIGHDVKATMRILAHWDIVLDGVAGDTMVAAHLLNPARTNQSLSDLSDEYLDQPLGTLPTLDTSVMFASAEWVEPFGRCAAMVTRLHELLSEKLNTHQLAPLYQELEVPLINVLAQMERVGIAIDVSYLAGLRASMDATLMRLTQEISRLAGCSFNLNSPKQLAQVLFERLQLPVIKRTKTGPSTDSDVLTQLAQRHPLPKYLIEYRELSKLVSTYVDALPKLADPHTGRIHTSFNQTATATGRLSSSEPNLQNIPIKTELGRSIRKAFVAGIPNGVLLAADYSQIELRILAHLSHDEQLLEAFRQDRDIHRFTASLIYGLPEADIQPEQRNAMKAINYGILYGMSSHGLSKELGISFEEAQTFIDAYFQRYPNVRIYLDQQIKQAKRDGFVQTLLGRRRYIPEVNSPDRMIQQLGERMAINAPIQGTAADLIKRAMVQVAKELAQGDVSARMVLQVHDELIFEAPQSEVSTLAGIVRRVMEGAFSLDVPLTVTMKVGPDWLDLQPIP